MRRDGEDHRRRRSDGREAAAAARANGICRKRGGVDGCRRRLPGAPCERAGGTISWPRAEQAFASASDSESGSGETPTPDLRREAASAGLDVVARRLTNLLSARLTADSSRPPASSPYLPGPPPRHAATIRVGHYRRRSPPPAV